MSQKTPLHVVLGQFSSKQCIGLEEDLGDGDVVGAVVGVVIERVINTLRSVEQQER